MTAKTITTNTKEEVTKILHYRHMFIRIDQYYNWSLFSGNPDACVGLCYYLKVQALKTQTKSAQKQKKSSKLSGIKKQSFTTEPTTIYGTITTTAIPSRAPTITDTTYPTTTTTRPTGREMAATMAKVATDVPTQPRRPCVGLCYYFRSKGLPNPYE